MILIFLKLFISLVFFLTKTNLMHFIHQIVFNTTRNQINNITPRSRIGRLR